MKKIIVMLMVAVMAISMSVSAFAADITATIDIDTTYQTIDGFGASYTWYSDWIATNINAEQGYDWIFNDAEFNILRLRDLYNVGDTSADEGEYKNCLDGYPAYKRLYDEAVERGIDPIVLVTSWGQYDRNLEWVAFNEKSEKGFSYYTLAKDENGEYMYDALVEHCVQAIKYFFEAGIPVHYFSIANEIELQERHVDENGRARAEAGFFLGMTETEDYAAYSEVHIRLYDAFQEAFGEWAPSIVGAEPMGGYADLLKGYCDPVLEANPEAIEVMAHHLYGTDLSAKNFQSVYNAYGDKFRYWQTEWYYNDYFDHAKVMIDEFVNENLAAYLYWNGVWVADTGNCLIEIGGADEDAYIQRIGNHYIMTHFSKYVKRGYQRVDVQYDGKARLVAFKSPDESKLVVIALNEMESGEDFDLTLDLGDVKVLGSKVVQSFESDSRFRHEYLTEMGEYSDGFLMPAGSLATFVFDLEGDPNYVAPVVSEEVNPFLKQPSAGLELDTNLIVIIAAAAVIVVVVIVLIAVLSKKKKAPKAEAEKPAE